MTTAEKWRKAYNKGKKTVQVINMSNINSWKKKTRIQDTIYKKDKCKENSMNGISKHWIHKFLDLNADFVMFLKINFLATNECSWYFNIEIT